MVRLTLSLVVICVLSVLNCAHSQHSSDSFCVKANGKRLSIEGGAGSTYAAPEMSDINGDGLHDLIVGMEDGRFRVYPNHGTNKEPVWKDYYILQAEGEDMELANG